MTITHYATSQDLTCEEIHAGFDALIKRIAELADASVLGAEVEKLRRQRQKVRDIHAPENSSDPSAPGAYCTGCSLHGARVMWPCPTFKATQDEQAPGFGGLL